MWSIGVGGNLSVDSAVFLGLASFRALSGDAKFMCIIEFIPASHQYLLTVLSIWWAIGELVGSLVSGN